MQLFQSLGYHASAPGTSPAHNQKEIANEDSLRHTTTDKQIAAVQRARGRRSAPCPLLRYLTPKERKGSSAGSPCEESRALFNLSAQLTGMLVLDYINQIEEPMLEPMGPDPGRSASMAEAITDYILLRMSSEFAEHGVVETRFLCDLVDGLAQSGHVSRAVQKRFGSGDR